MRAALHASVSSLTRSFSSLSARSKLLFAAACSLVSVLIWAVSVPTLFRSERRDAFASASFIFCVLASRSRSASHFLAVARSCWLSERGALVLWP